MTTEIVTQRRIAAAMKLIRGISTEELESVSSYEELLTTVVSEHKMLMNTVKDLCQGNISHTTYVGQRLPESLVIKIFAPNR